MNKILAKPKSKYKSTFEWEIANQLKKAGIKNPKYEPYKIEYVVPAVKKKYIPDFVLPNGIHIECKGHWPLVDRKKMLQVIQSNPDLDIRMVFQNAQVRISRQSKTTYGQYATKHGIKWAHKIIPLEWLTEKG